jgi:hypothetical protein
MEAQQFDSLGIGDVVETGPLMEGMTQESLRWTVFAVDTTNDTKKLAAVWFNVTLCRYTVKKMTQRGETKLVWMELFK